jgi:hypothetical protein
MPPSAVVHFNLQGRTVSCRSLTATSARPSTGGQDRQQLDADRVMVDERTHAIIHLEHHVEQ